MLNSTSKPQSDQKNTGDQINIDREIANFFLENQDLFIHQNRNEIYSSNENAKQFHYNLDSLVKHNTN